MDLLLMVNAKAQVVSVFSPLPFKITEDKRVDAAIAVTVDKYNDKFLMISKGAWDITKFVKWENNN